MKKEEKSKISLEIVKREEGVKEKRWCMCNRLLYIPVLSLKFGLFFLLWVFFFPGLQWVNGYIF